MATQELEITLPLTADSPIIQEALRVWHEAGRDHFNRSYPNCAASPELNYDSPDHVKTAKERRKYIALDNGTSGAFLVDKLTGLVYGIKAYGVPNRIVMHISKWTSYWTASADDNQYRLLYVGRR